MTLAHAVVGEKNPRYLKSHSEQKFGDPKTAPSSSAVPPPACVSLLVLPLFAPKCGHFSPNTSKLSLR